MTSRGEQRRAEIVEAALDLFTERGYHDTGVADIATRLHMSHGTFYRYFESKRDILEHLVDLAAGRMAAMLADGAFATQAQTVDQYRDQVERIASGLLTLVFEDPRYIRLILFEATGVDAAMTEKVLALLDSYRALTAAYLQQGVSAAYLPADLDATETARALNGIVFAGALSALRSQDGSPEDLSGFRDAALRLMFHGIAGPAGA